MTDRLFFALKIIVGLACGYEAVAISASLAGSPKPPTISVTVGVSPWLGLPIVAGLVAHFYWSRITRILKEHH